MAKARTRSAARRVKDKWRSKNWYQILAPTLFDDVPISETLSENPENLIGRVTNVSLQDITNDFRKSHIKLLFKINKVEEGNAHTQFKGHTLTSDYLRKMIRRKKSRVDGIYDVETKDGARLRVKPFAIADKRVQNSQKKLIRNTMKETITKEGKTKTLNEFLRDIFDGKIGSEIYRDCKKFYPVKRVEIYKTEIKRVPTVEIEEKEPPKKKETEETKEIDKKKKKEKGKKKTDKEEGKKEKKTTIKEEDEEKKAKTKKKTEPSTTEKKEKAKQKEKKITKKPVKKKKSKAKKESKPTQEKTVSKKQKKKSK
ncbi:MAG: 30S ribosomal protein S3ae [Petrotogales bacterium]